MRLADPRVNVTDRWRHGFEGYIQVVIGVDWTRMTLHRMAVRETVHRVSMRNGREVARVDWGDRDTRWNVGW